MYKELFLLCFASSMLFSSSVDSTSIVCDELLRIFDDKSNSKGAIGRIRNAINRACTALDLLRHGINPLDLISGGEVTKRKRRPKKPVTTTEAAIVTTAKSLASDETAAVTSTTATPLELLLNNSKVNIILSNFSTVNNNSAFQLNAVHSRNNQQLPLETRIAMDCPKHLLPLDYNLEELNNTFTAVYEIRTRFSCKQQPHDPGVYADISLGCKVFHLCVSTDPYHNRTSFHCPESLLFNQEMLRCDYPTNVNCNESYRWFNINENFHKKFDIKYVIFGKVN